MASSLLDKKRLFDSGDYWSAGNTTAEVAKELCQHYLTDPVLGNMKDLIKQEYPGTAVFFQALDIYKLSEEYKKHGKEALLPLLPGPQIETIWSAAGF